MSLTQLITLCFVGIGLFNMGWSSRVFFTRPTGSAGGVRLIEVLATLFGATQLAVVVLQFNGGGISFIVGCILFLLSIGLLHAAKHANRLRPLSFAFSKDVPEHLVAEGVYLYIRHPFYTSYLLHWLAAPLASGQELLLIPFLVMLAVYSRAAFAEERKFDESPLREQYSDYRLKTGFFLPFL